MSITEYNGGGVVAMMGKNCVAIASDSRLGIRFKTVATDFKKIFKMGDKLYVGLSGLATDVQTVAEKLEFRTNMYRLREEREMEPPTFTRMLSNMLYERRFGPYFVGPVIAGLDKDNKPYVSAMDLIGAIEEPDGFIAQGTCAENLMGLCESMYKPDMDEEELFETISQCLLSAVDRDAYSGWGAVVHVITPKGVRTRLLRTRMD